MYWTILPGFGGGSMEVALVHVSTGTRAKQVAQTALDSRELKKSRGGEL